MANPLSKLSTAELAEHAFKVAGTAEEKAFEKFLDSLPVKKATDFERLLAAEVKAAETLLPQVTKAGAIGAAAKLAGKAAGPVGIALSVADAVKGVADAVAESKKEKAEAARREEENEKRKKRTWEKGLVKYEDAMRIVNESVSSGAEVDAVEAQLQPLILSQRAPRHAQPLKFPTVFPNGEPERYIMRRGIPIGGEDDMPVLHGELVPLFCNGGRGAEPPPPLQVELIPVKRVNAPTPERSEDGNASPKEKGASIRDAGRGKKAEGAKIRGAGGKSASKGRSPGKGE